MKDINPINLDRYIRNSGLSFKENSRSFICDCPRCRKQDKLYIRKSDGLFRCWVCEADGFHGKAEYALTELLSAPIEDVRKELYGEIEVAAKEFLNVEWVDPNYAPIDERTPIVWAPEHVPVEASRVGTDYLLNRGIPLDVAKEYHIMFNTKNRRVALPVEEDGRLYGWQERATGSTEYTDPKTGKVKNYPKILGSKHLPRSKSLMFADRITGDHAVLCEGPFDALACHLCGGNVATMGKSVDEGQLTVLRRKNIKKLYIALDPDAEKEAQLLAKKMADLELYRLLPSPGKKDLGEMSLQEVYQAFLEAPRINPHLMRAALKPF